MEEGTTDRILVRSLSEIAAVAEAIAGIECFRLSGLNCRSETWKSDRTVSIFST